jgi:hypothetical protein
MDGYRYDMNAEKGPSPIVESGPQEGIVPRSVQLLFDYIKQETNLGRKRYTVHVSFLQVYKEKIYDLLNKSHLKRLI